MKIGLVRAFEYYRNSVLWQTFFEYLNQDIVVSSETNKQILDLGIKNSVDESCLSAKIFMGHVAYLQDKCDCILISRLDNIGKNEFACTKFNALYDMAASSFDIDILDYNIDIKKGHNEKKGLLNIAKRLKINHFGAQNAYKKAKTAQILADSNKYTLQKKSLSFDGVKILIVAHDYNIYDNFVGQPVLKMLKSFGANVILACEADKNICATLSKSISPTLYWRYNKELIGAIELYKNDIDGIVFLSAFPCGPDSLVNELMLRRYAGKFPFLNIIVDEHQSETGLATRIESFYDLLTAKEHAK